MSRYILTVCVVCVLCFCLSCDKKAEKIKKETTPSSQTQQLQKQREESEIKQIKVRFEDEHMGTILSGRLWTLIHRVPQHNIQQICAVLGIALEPGTASSLEDTISNAGGVEQYRQNVTQFLTDKNEVIRGFAAIWLGVYGDPKSTNDVIGLLRSEKLSLQDPSNEGLDRGWAAEALGLLGANAYAQELATLLRSPNWNIRQGAALGLAYMHANEYANEIAQLLWDHEDHVQISAVHALANMNARECAGEIAQLLQEDVLGDPLIQESALYALAQLDAKEYAQTIARFLHDEFRKGDAAKALALMHAEEYVSDIVAMLEDQDSLHRSAALVALGIMRIKTSEDIIAKHLHDQEVFVRMYAAWALVMLESRTYASHAIHILGDQPVPSTFLIEGAAEGAAREKFSQLMKESDTSLKKLQEGDETLQ